MSKRRRRLELVSLSSAALVAFLTRWYVGAYTATELNPLVGYLVEPFGWTAYAVAKVGAVLVAIVALEVASTWEYDGNRRWSWSYFSEVGAGWVAFLSVANLLHDVVSASHVGIPPGPPVNALVGYALILAGLLVASYGRRELLESSRTIANQVSERATKGQGHKVAAAIAAILVVTSGLGGISLTQNYSAVQNASAAGTVVEDFDDGTSSLSAATITSESINGPYGGNYTGGPSGVNFGSTTSDVYSFWIKRPSNQSGEAYPDWAGVNGRGASLVIHENNELGQAYEANTFVDTREGVFLPDNEWARVDVRPDFAADTFTVEVYNKDGSLRGSFSKSFGRDVTAIDTYEGENQGEYYILDEIRYGGTYSSGYTVSGTVSGPEGPIEGATVSDGNGNSTTTNASGGYSFTLQNGTYDLTADAGSGYTTTTETVTVDGGPVTQNFTVGGNLQGTVTKKEGGACADCTVELWLMADANTTTDTGQTVQEAQEDTIETLSRSVPRDLYEEDLDVLNAERYTGDNAGKQVLVHTYGDWYEDGEPFGDASTGYGTVGEGLDTPVRQLEPDKKYAFSIWDRTRDPTLEDGVDQQVEPGVSSSGTIVVERIGPGNSTISKSEHETGPIVKTGTGNLFTVKTHEAAGIALPEGYYKVYPKSGGNPVYYRVGQPEKIPRSIPDTDLQDAENTTAAIAQEVQDKVDAGAMQRVTVQTDANGKFSYSVPDGYSTVSITVFDGRGLLSGINDPSLSDLRSQIKSQNYNGSIYMSTSPKIVHPPDQDVQITVVEIKRPTLSDLADYFDQLAWLEDLLNTEAFGKIQSLFTDPLGSGETTLNELLDTRDRLAGTIDGNEQLRERYNELAEERGLPPLSDEDLTREEVQRQIGAMQEVLFNLQDTTDGDSTPGTTSPTIPEVDTTPNVNVGGTTVTIEIPTSEDLNTSESAPSVVCQEPTGSTRWVNASNVSVEEGLTGDSLVIQEVLSNQTAGCNYLWFAPTEDGGDGVVPGGDEDESPGVVRGGVNVPNPSFDGTIPELSSINVNTMRPGPDETVTVGVTPTETSSYQSLNGATVYGPDGSSLPTTLDGSKVEFTTNGAGSHLVKLNVSDGSSNYIETFRVKAGNSSVDYPASVRVHNGVLGRTAIAGDGVESAEVSTDAGGSEARITARVNGQDPPSELHVHARDLSGLQQDVSVSVVDETDDSRVSRSIQVKLHLNRLQDSALVRVNGNPIDTEANKWGEVEHFSSSTLINTYTEDGTVDVSVNNNPSFVDRAWFFAQSVYQDLPLPSLGVVVLESPSVMAEVVGSVDVGPLAGLVNAQEVVA
ncbi:carboxypeptidase-like regulatory domain-containing protein [Halorarius halobius]|uniref:carboxypeptidase-like regulatory domain-containing protein n=1 Tax=Halorarius halobius TaxID=2962671 RepID=UPI0020CB9DF3|nr:carboxypeptidase-like regulatory domain-containing protein [Halorarius halobius]